MPAKDAELPAGVFVMLLLLLQALGMSTVMLSGFGGWWNQSRGFDEPLLVVAGAAGAAADEETGRIDEAGLALALAFAPPATAVAEGGESSGVGVSDSSLRWPLAVGGWDCCCCCCCCCCGC